MNENASTLFTCSQCGSQFQPQPHSLFLFDERTPVYCETCRAAVSEEFVAMLASRLDEDEKPAAQLKATGNQ